MYDLALTLMAEDTTFITKGCILCWCLRANGGPRSWRLIRAAVWIVDSCDSSLDDPDHNDCIAVDMSSSEGSNCMANRTNLSTTETRTGVAPCNEIWLNKR